LAVSTNFDPDSVPLLRFGWREGANVMMCAGPQSPPAAAELPDAGARVVHPALLVRSGRTAVFALSDRQLLLASFTPKPGNPLLLDGAVTTATQFAVAPVAAASTLAPEKLGGKLHVVAAGAEGDNLVLMGWDESAASTGRMDIPGVVAWKASQPALHVDPDGSVQVALLVRHMGLGFKPALVRATFAPGGAPRGMPSVSDLPWSDAFSMDSAAVAFEGTTETAGQPAWAVALRDGRIVHAGNPAGTPTKAPPASPVQLILFHGTKYVLLIDPQKGPALAAL
jgi:hypothetical protein